MGENTDLNSHKDCTIAVRAHEVNTYKGMVLEDGSVGVVKSWDVESTDVVGIMCVDHDVAFRVEDTHIEW
ncbi:MAG: hypothetical protein ABIJ75_07215 [Actinomycetota bacterium]